MSPETPESNPGGPTDASREGSESEAVETFTFDVSAGERTEVDQPQPTLRAEPTRRPAPTGKESARRTPAKLEPGSPTLDSPLARPQAETATELESPPAPIPQIDPTETDPLKKRHRGLPSWTVSLAVHAVVLVLLSFYTLVTLKEEELALYASTTAYEEVEEFQEVEIDPSEDLESLESDLVSELSDPGEAAFGDLSAESALADVTRDTLTSDSLGDLGNMFGDTGTGLTGEGDGPGGAATARFFGTKVEGKRILYMLDNSGGMLRKGKFETLVDELLTSVASLTPKQQFYVIFYSDTVYPLFYPQSATDFVRATDKNRQSLQRWLATVELCTGNAIDEAIAAAEVIRPDTVFLLTDGDLFTTKKKKEILLRAQSRRYQIHTFGMGVKENTKYADQLQTVAEANRGTYRTVAATAAAAALARDKGRPYHKDGPGPVWGRNVRARLKK